MTNGNAYGKNLKQAEARKKLCELFARWLIKQLSKFSAKFCAFTAPRLKDFPWSR